MPALSPTPSIQIPVAPVRAIAQSPRSGRTGGAIEQESASFKSALRSAGKPVEKPIVDPPVSVEKDQVDAEGADAEPAEIKTAVAESEAGRAPVPPVEPESNPTEPATEHESEPEPGTVIDPGQILVAPAALPAPEQPVRGTTIAGAPTQPEPERAAPEAAGAQPAPGAILSQAPDAGVTPSDPDAVPVKPLAKPETPAVTPVAIAPAPQPAPGSSAPAPVDSAEGHAILPEAPSDAQTTAGDGQRPDLQKHSAQAGAESVDPAPTPAPTDTAAAQSLRHAGAEPAPVQVDPSPIESPTPGAITGKPAAQPPAPSAPSLGSVEPDQAFTTAVNRGLAAAVRQQGGTLTIKLDPPTLGKMTIRMTIDQGRVEASFDVQTAQARDLLMEHSSTLRAQLRERGLTVERFEVIGAAGASRPGHPASNPGNQPGSDGGPGDPRHDAAGGQSRGRSETGEEQPSTGDGATGESAGIAGEPMTSPFETQLRYSVSAVG